MALKRDLAGWLETKLTEIERRHRLDSKNAQLLRQTALKRFSKYTGSSKSVSRERKPFRGINHNVSLPFQFFPDLNGLNGRKSSGSGLRRAHSEELMSEVGLQKLEDQNNNSKRSRRTSSKDNSSYKGLQVSDTPTRPQEHQQLEEQLESPPPPLPSRSTRVRRNSAGDEISSILDHSGLVVLNNNEDDEPEYLNYYGNQHALHGPPMRHHFGRVGDNGVAEDEEGVMPLGSTSMTTEASSSLNTTIVGKLEVSER